MKLRSIYIDNDEIAVINKMKKGDFKAFEMLYEKYFNTLLLFTLKLVKVRVEAEEIVQNLFLKVWLRRESVDENQNFKAYIYRIAINDVYNYTRKRTIERAYQEHLKNRFEESDQKTMDDIYFSDMQFRIGKLVEKMPPQRRQIFQMNKEQGLTNEEISIVLNLSKRTVENHMYRAISFLKQNIKEGVSVLIFIILSIL
jgi:RNA polymerase sigma-70 factor (family 1)